MKIVIGSRGSKLALVQAEWVRDQLITVGHEVEIRRIRTTGDRQSEGHLPVQAGTKQLFVKEIEEALLDGGVDLAVHSLKDMPAEQPVGLRVAAVPRREDPRDVLVSSGNRLLEALPMGARVGTSSLRRQIQLLRLRPDLMVLPINGNVDTRLRKLARGEYDALLLAAAGLNRLELSERITSYFAPEEMCPAVGQGALAIQIRESDELMARALAPLDHAESRQAVLAERAVIERLGGGCDRPIAAHAWVDTKPATGVAGEAGLEEPLLAVRGVVMSTDARVLLEACCRGPMPAATALGQKIAEDLLGQGAAEILGI